MSIWCSHDHIGTDTADEYEISPGLSQIRLPGDPEPEGRRVVHETQRGTVLTYAEGFSNHYPDLTGTHERPANVSLADIAPWCTPGHFDCGHDHPENGEWVRLDVDASQTLSFWTKDDEGKPTNEVRYASAVLDEEAARSLAADLLAWADSPHLKPTEDA